jgi:hypothetical protein
MADLSSRIAAALREIPRSEPKTFTFGGEPRRYSDVLAERSDPVAADRDLADLEGMFDDKLGTPRNLQIFANTGRRS